MAKARANKKRAAKSRAAKSKSAKSKAASRKPAAKSSAAKRSAKKTVAKKAAARPARSPAKSIARRKPATRKVRDVAVALAPKPAAKPQKVAISHYNNNDFESGLRTYAQYRDLGIVEASNGMVRAHVLRFTEPCDPKVVSKLHYHDTEFQMVYVLKGWVKTKLGHHDEITMRQGSSWTQPPKIKHVINDYSDDCELLEIILPADFETTEV